MIADLFKAVADVKKRRVRAGFWGSGAPNTMAMVFDERLGEGNWDYVLRVEGNEYNARVHDYCWEGRVMAKQERMEAPVQMPDGVAPPNDVSLHGRCQPWALQLNRYGLKRLELAIRERLAMYRSVRAIEPDIVVDEMLSRKRVAGHGVAWKRVEKLRKGVFDGYAWITAESDPGEEETEFSRSARELAIGFKPEVAAAVVGVLLAHGFELVGEEEEEKEEEEDI